MFLPCTTRGVFRQLDSLVYLIALEGARDPVELKWVICLYLKGFNSENFADLGDFAGDLQDLVFAFFVGLELIIRVGFQERIGVNLKRVGALVGAYWGLFRAHLC